MHTPPRIKDGEFLVRPSKKISVCRPSSAWSYGIFPKIALKTLKFYSRPTSPPPKSVARPFIRGSVYGFPHSVTLCQSVTLFSWINKWKKWNGANLGLPNRSKNTPFSRGKSIFQELYMEYHSKAFSKG